MPSSIEFDSVYDFAGLRVHCNAERRARNGATDGADVLNVLNNVDRGPDWTDANTPTWHDNQLNGEPIFRFGSNEGFTEALGDGNRQEELHPLVDDWIQWMYEGPILVMTVMRQTGDFSVQRNWFGFGASLGSGWNLQTNTSTQFVAEWSDGSSDYTQVLTPTPVQNDWYICMWSWDGETDSQFRIGLNSFYEDADLVDLSSQNFLAEGAGGYPYGPWQFGQAWANNIDAGECAMWAFWRGIEANEKAWDGLLRYAGTKYDISLS